MSFQFTTTEKVMAGLILVITFIFFFRECGHQRDEDSLVSNITSYKDSAKYYNLKVDGMKVEVAYNKSLVLENDKQIKSVLSSMNDTIARLIKKFKDVKSGTIINNYTSISGDTIKLKGDSIPCDFKAFKVRRDSVYYHFVGTIAKSYFSIDTLSIPDKTTLIIGRKKIGFLKYEERAELFHSNPLVHTTNIGNYETIKRKKRIGIGASVGYGFNISKDAVRMSPYIGISVNYNLFEF
jgi:hypothetical protein